MFPQFDHWEIWVRVMNFSFTLVPGKTRYPLLRLEGTILFHCRVKESRVTSDLTKNKILGTQTFWNCIYSRKGRTPSIG